MADRFYPNEMPNAPSEGLAQESASDIAKDSLSKLLSLPFDTMAQRLKDDALNLKEEVVRETWGVRGRPIMDYSLYTGTLGTAFLLFKAYQVTQDQNDLSRCLEIVEACDSASHGSGPVTFIMGQAGVYALGAVAAKHRGDDKLLHQYLSKFREIQLPVELSDEILYGRAGYLWACLYLNKHLGKGTISISQMRAVAIQIIRRGRKLAKLAGFGWGKVPLMYEWKGVKYWGAAHGLAGIMHVLMDVELKPDEMEDIKQTLLYMIKNRLPSGNYPAEDGDDTDTLVHWCHGAPGIVLTLAKAAKVFGDEEFLQAAEDAWEVVWKRGLLKRVSVCHGISGNTYVFLSLYRLTGKEEYLYRAKAFACFLHDRAHTFIDEGLMHPGDHPYSLFEGMAGMAYLFLEMTKPSSSKFPGYEL